MLSADETKELIERIERRAGCGMPYRADYDAFKDAFMVRELPTTTLSALGYAEDWIYNVFDSMLEDALLRHNASLVDAGYSPAADRPPALPPAAARPPGLPLVEK